MKSGVYFGAVIGAIFFLESCSGGGISSSGGSAGSSPIGSVSLPGAVGSVGASPNPSSSCAPLGAGGLAPTLICGAVAVTSAPPVASSPVASVSCQGSASSGGAGGASGASYNGGPLIGCANVVVLCLNAPCTTYGTDGGMANHNESPCDFWNRLDTSPMIHAVDQYVGQTSDNRYVCTKSIEVDGVPTGALSDKQMLDIITANIDGTGLNAVYNLFMTSAQLATSGACAYHTSAQISVSGQQSQVIYSANATCGAEDDMNHEMFEAISDPGADQSGWIKSSTGDEIADLCETTEGPNPSMPGYTMQPVWSNSQNGCAYAGP